MLSDDALVRLIDLYFAAWNAPDAPSSAAILAEIWAPDGTYTDPRSDCHGAAELAQQIQGVRAGRPGAKVVLTSKVDRHHNVLRFHWCVEMPDGSRLPEGIDFGEVTADGKLRRIVGFFGPLKAV